MPLCVCTRLPKYVTIKDVLILCIRRLRRRRKTGKEKKNMIVRAVSKEKNNVLTVVVWRNEQST